MKKYFLFQIFQSKYCWIVFLFAIITVSAVIPKKIFYQYYTIIGILFILISSLVITCLARNIKERAVLARKKQASFWGIVFMLIGFAAMSTCSIGVPICGASVVGGLLAVFFPGFMLAVLSQYSLLIIISSLFMQILALYYLNCFKKLKYE